MLDLKVSLEGTDKVSAALRNAQRTIGEATSPVLRDVASSIKTTAEGRASQRRVHNLWRSSSGRMLSPRYRTEFPGAYMARVSTGGGASGKAEAIAEFASSGITPQGAAMVRGLSHAWGGTGRILWRTHDDLSDELASRFDAAVAAAASKIEGSM